MYFETAKLSPIFPVCFVTQQPDFHPNEPIWSSHKDGDLPRVQYVFTKSARPH